MTTDAVLSSAEAMPSRRSVLRALENRFLAPAFITCILLAAQLSFGILESYDRTVLAIVTAIAAELVMGRITYRHWPHPASAYITGISVGILVRSPFFWPHVLTRSDRHRDRRRTGDGPNHVPALASPGQRVYHRYQRWDSGALAILLAVCADQLDLNRVQVRVAVQGPALVESVELRRQRDIVSRAGDGLSFEHPVGQYALAHGCHLAARRGDRLASRSSAHQRHIRPVFYRSVVHSE